MYALAVVLSEWIEDLATQIRSKRVGLYQKPRHGGLWVCMGCDASNDCMCHAWCKARGWVHGSVYSKFTPNCQNPFCSRVEDEELSSPPTEQSGMPHARLMVGHFGHFIVSQQTTCTRLQLSVNPRTTNAKIRAVAITRFICSSARQMGTSYTQSANATVHQYRRVPFNRAPEGCYLSSEEPQLFFSAQPL